MASRYEINAVQGQVRYSGRRGGLPRKSAEAPVGNIDRSPVWSLAVVVFIAGLVLHDLLVSIAFVLTQLSVMTAGQWLAMYVHRNGQKLRIKPFRILPALKAIRFAAFGMTILLVVLSV